MKEAFNYLSKLTEIERKNSPESFFHEGNNSLLESGRRVSVVGSRKISDIGIKRTQKITKFLVESGITVVSGLAEGVDTVTHSTTINSRGNTIAVIGTPLNKCFPAQNRELQNFIAKEHLLISQFPESSPTTQKKFLFAIDLWLLLVTQPLLLELVRKVVLNTKAGKHYAWVELFFFNGKCD